MSPTLQPKALLLGVVFASFAAGGQAEAACTPPTTAGTPVVNAPVTCSGATTNQNGTTGYGVPQDNGNTINVQAGASVTGATIGVQITGFGSFTDATTINNFGTISGGSGVQGSSGIVNNKSGAIISGTSATGILIFSQGSVSNLGACPGKGLGIQRSEF